MEEIIRDTITVHMKENELLSKHQFGFIKGRSTVLQLLKVLDTWTEMLDNGGQCWFDISKYRDTCESSIPIFSGIAILR